MTGFGRGTASLDHCTASVEIASINRKQAEIVIRSGRDLGALEVQIRKLILNHISRGRIQVTIELDRPPNEAPPVEVDLALAAAFEEGFKKLSAELGREIVPSPADFIKAPGILRFDDTGIPVDDLWSSIEPALQGALDQMIEMRAAEGAALGEDIITRLETLENFCKQIIKAAPDRPQRYRETLLKRLGDSGLELDLDDERVVREIGIFADRCDISEEVTRLDAHFLRFREYLQRPEPAGRPLDFLCQEIHREFNTIGSKASDAEIAQTIVSAKTELEKIREQVQNIE